MKVVGFNWVLKGHPAVALTPIKHYYLNRRTTRKPVQGGPWTHSGSLFLWSPLVLRKHVLVVANFCVHPAHWGFLPHRRAHSDGPVVLRVEHKVDCQYIITKQIFILINLWSVLIVNLIYPCENFPNMQKTYLIQNRIHTWYNRIPIWYNRIPT